MGNAKVINGCRIGGNCIIMDNATVSSYVTIMNKRLILKENAKIVGPETVKCDNVIIKDNTQYKLALKLLLRYGKPNKNNEYTVYKLVKSTDQDFVYESCYDQQFKYDLRKKKFVTFSNYARSKKLCDEGLHVSFSNTYSWAPNILSTADRMLTCLINVDDIVAIDKPDLNKARVKRLKVTKVTNYPTMQDLPHVNIYHNLNSIYMYPCVYNNKTNVIHNEFHVYFANFNAAKVMISIDGQEQKVSDYNIVFLSAAPSETYHAVSKPKFHTQTIMFRYNHDLLIQHDFNTKHIIAIIYDMKDYTNCTEKFRIELTSKDNISITPLFPFTKYDEFRVMLIAPAMPLVLGKYDERGIANATPDSQVILFMGSDCDKNKSIDIKHKYNTFDVFGSIIDYDNKEILNDIIFKRIDYDTINITFGKNYYKNHQYALFITSCEI